MKKSVEESAQHDPLPVLEVWVVESRRWASQLLLECQSSVSEVIEAAPDLPLAAAVAATGRWVSDIAAAELY